MKLIKLPTLVLAVLSLAGCGSAGFTTFDPYADGGSAGDAGADAGAGGGGGSATGGGGGTGGGATGGGGGATGGGAGTGGGAATGGGGGTTACGPASCLGCCANGACVTNPTTAQCGRGGAACSACGASDVCKSDGTCGVDPASVWRVAPVAAVIAATNGGLEWDSSSDPDAELGVWCPSTEVNVSLVTSVATDDFTPSWSGESCTATAAELLADGIGFDAIEIDLVDHDDLAPFAVAPVTEADLRAGTKVTAPNGGLQSVTFQLTRQ